MKKYGVNELREMFLRFFEGKEHLRMKSFSLIPHNDNSLLIINSGMAPLKPYFTGAEIPPRRRVTTCQKCVRTGDIENVGKTARHGTFFEMLGNFSFGDYFKNEAIPWAWEFLTEVVGLPADRLYPSIYEDDDEAFEIWNKKMGIAPERIFRFGKEDNFWEHGSGPCDPCSEIYYDRGEKYGCGKPGCTVGCDCDRYMEVWNLVFTQFDNDGEGHYSRLEQTNIDTGMGLERLAVVVQDVDSIFDVDTLRALRDEVCRMAGVTYLQDHETDVSIRVITDHIRSATFMISDGIMPTNEGRGYVLRRLIRRAARHGRKLGINHAFLADLAGAVMEGSKDGYPELVDKKDFIVNVLNNEEKQFNRTIDQGLTILAGMEEKMKAEGKTVLAGEDAFRLYDTFGFPLDLTQDILEEKGYSVDEEGFAVCMKEQQTRAREARAVSNYMGAEATVYDEIDPSLTTEFCGYDWLSCDAKITVLTRKPADAPDELAEVLKEGEEGAVITDKSPFYGTMGGQEGDTGVIKTPQGKFLVKETIHLRGDKLGHIGVVESGEVHVGDAATLTVDYEGRQDTCKNHSATHLLQKALKTVLGDHVEQKGSLVSPTRLRFDFSHFQPMTTEEIRKVEEIVNREIREGLFVQTDIMSLEDARKTGAMALFDEKYGEKVRVVSMGNFSRELCGGTHVKNTADIFWFKIVSEAGIAAGVRRIEALTGSNVIRHLEEEEMLLQNAAASAKIAPTELAEHIQKQAAEIKRLQHENEALKSKIAAGKVGNIEDNVQDIAGVKLLAASVPDVDGGGLRDLGDQLRDKIGEGVIVLVSEKDGKVGLVVMATDAAQKAGAHAGNLIKEAASYIGGRGGGRPNMAQAGGKDPSGIEALLKAVPDLLRSQLS
ncbi:MAG: alanine--tRNA ligase [Eubacterium sp.]|nr:alanine--tRNA ligase [Eubacterium sp.]